MESLLLEFQSKIAHIPLTIQRYLIDQINLKNRLIAINGTKGAGKNKIKKQIAGTEHAYIAKDGIEIGFGNIIPV